eukprot:SAG22_NODE_14022_length_387_cov_1.208333_1_plen_82_part_10
MSRLQRNSTGPVGNRFYENSERDEHGNVLPQASSAKVGGLGGLAKLGGRKPRVQNRQPSRSPSPRGAENRLLETRRRAHSAD